MISRSLVAASLLAAALAGLIEVSVSAWRGEDVGLGFVAVHLAWLFGLGLVFAALAVAAGAERIAARLWFVAPAVVVMASFMLRRFGFGASLVAALIVLLAVWRLPEIGRESIVAGGVAGSILGVRTAVFFVKEYDGRNTGVGFLVGLVLTAAVAALIYGAVAILRSSKATAGSSKAAIDDESRPPLPAPRVWVAIVTVSILALAVAGWTGTPIPRRLEATALATEQPPVVVVVLDTVRADHLELYGYERETMPRLAEFARSEAVVVDRAISNAPDSLASHASLFTGLFPANHGAHRPLLVDTSPRFGYPMREDVPTLASVLRDAGYATMAVSANYGPASAEIGLGIDRGFDVYRSHPDGVCAFTRLSPWRSLARAIGGVVGESVWMPPCRRRYRRAGEITDEAIALIDAAGDSSFLLFVNYMDAHGPYDPPVAFRQRFEGYDPAAGEAGVTPAVRRGDADLPAAVRDHLVALYDGELAYLDTQLARLLDYLEQHSAWDEMLLVITADHGEAFGEHRLLDHSSSLYDVMIRVPLILKGGRNGAATALPGPGTRWDHPMQLVDIMPLALAHAGLEVPAGLDGRRPIQPPAPLRSWSFPPRAKVRFSERFRRELRSIEIEGFKLIEDHAGNRELYDLADDPGELHDLAAEQPGRVTVMLEAMGPWTTYRAANRPAEQALSNEALERLRSLGYLR